MTDSLTQQAAEHRKTFVKFLNDDHESKIEVVDGADSNAADYPQVSVILPTGDAWRSGYFPKLLEQLRTQTYQNFETIIVKGDPRQGRAINMGVALARGSILITLDDDTELGQESVFAELYAVMSESPDIGMAGVANTVPDNANAIVRWQMTQIPRRSSPILTKITDCDMAEHPCAAFSATAFREIGGENELIPRGLDPYLRHELREHDYRVVVIPGAHIHHLPPQTWRGFLRMAFRNGKGSAYAQKFHPQWAYDTATKPGEFEDRRSLGGRLIRKLCNLLEAVFSGRLVYVIQIGWYTTGYFWGYITMRRTSKL